MATSTRPAVLQSTIESLAAINPAFLDRVLLMDPSQLRLAWREATQRADNLEITWSPQEMDITPEAFAAHVASAAAEAILLADLLSPATRAVARALVRYHLTTTAAQAA